MRRNPMQQLIVLARPPDDRCTTGMMGDHTKSFKARMAKRHVVFLFPHPMFCSELEFMFVLVYVWLVCGVDSAPIGLAAPVHAGVGYTRDSPMRWIGLDFRLDPDRFL